MGNNPSFRAFQDIFVVSGFIINFSVIFSVIPEIYRFRKIPYYFAGFMLISSFFEKLVTILHFSPFKAFHYYFEQDFSRFCRFLLKFQAICAMFLCNLIWYNSINKLTSMHSFSMKKINLFI